MSNSWINPGALEGLIGGRWWEGLFATEIGPFARGGRTVLVETARRASARALPVWVPLGFHWFHSDCLTRTLS